MFHYVNAITNTKGDALIGYYVRLQTSDGTSVALYADENGTPIESVSEVTDAAKVDHNGNVSFYVGDGEYTVLIYATDSTTFVDSYTDIPMAKMGMLQAATRSDLANTDTGFPVALTEIGFEGIFFFRASDLSIEVAADPDQHTFIAPASDDTGASGAWVRSGSQAVTDIVESGVVSGCGIAYRELLIFDMSAGTYNLDNVLHTALEQSITLAVADGSNPRIDVLYLDTDGVLGKLTGTPAASPSKPQVDPTTQLELTFVTVPSGATSLAAVTTEDIYLENAEWTTTQSGTALTLASTNNPYAGTKCIETTGTFGTGNYVNFADSGNSAFGGDGNLILRIRSKTTWNSKRLLTIQFWCDGATIGSPAALRTGAYGFDSSTTDAYQVIIIPKSVFAIPASVEIDALRITCAGSGNSVPSFYLDNVQLQTNGTAVGGSDLNQSIADARYVNVTGDTMTGDLVVPPDSYGAGWNGSNEVPTKNDVYDKIETLSGTIPGAYTDEQAQDAVGTILTDTTTIDFTYTDATPSITADVKDNSVSDAKLRQGTALTVIGRSANSTGNVADISAGSDGQVLRRSGTSLGFGTVATAGIADAAVTLAKIQNAAANSKLVGSGAAGSGAAYSEITLGTGLSMSGTTLNSSAAGNAWSLQWGPLVNEPPNANFATLDTRNLHPVLNFDASTAESSVFTGVMPNDYSGAGVTVILYWAGATATSGDVMWQVAFEANAANGQDIDSDGFATAQAFAAATANGTSGKVTKSSLNVSNGANMDSIAAGDLFRIQIARDATNGSDTMTGDAQLLRVMVVSQ